MSSTMADEPKRKKKPVTPAGHLNPKETFHLPAGLIERMQRFRDAQDLRPSKSEVMRKALEKYLEERGF